MEEVTTTFDFQPLFDFLQPYLIAHFFILGLVVALLIVILFGMGWQSNAK